MRNERAACGMRWVLVLLVVLAGPALAARKTGKSHGKTKLKKYTSTYYVIHTDMHIDKVHEAHARMTVMVKEYRRRTKGFAGKIRKKLPFFMFSKREDYYAAGGMPGSSGVFMGNRLMVVADERTGDFVWHTVQHEGFHQFVRFVIRGKIPIWVNEGLAEYFGEGVWTGDRMVTGLIPPDRLKRVKREIRSGAMLPFAKMLAMTDEQWSANLTIRNYDQAWSMCHFLIHADDGKYHKKFVAFVKDISRGREVKRSFINRLGKNLKSFENRYEQWWTKLPANPTADTYTKALVQTLTSYLARAQVYKKKFENVEEFFAAARAGKIANDSKRYPKLWLPPSLLACALDDAAEQKTWSLNQKGKKPRLLLTKEDGTVFRGEFKLRTPKIPQVKVKIIRTAPATQPAGKKEPTGK